MMEHVSIWNRHAFQSKDKHYFPLNGQTRVKETGTITKGLREVERKIVFAAPVMQGRMALKSR